MELARFTVITDIFEQSIAHNGLPADATQPNKEIQRPAPFPLHQPWWFRQIEPEGWSTVKGGVQWNYKDYKPKDAIAVSYFLTTLPKSPEDVDTFADWFLKRLKPGVSAADELTRVKNVLLATYGKEPEDSLTRHFVEEEMWYSPRKDLSMANMNAKQRAQLEKMIRRIAAIEITK